MVDFRHRRQLAEVLRAFRSVVAEEVTNVFLARHPEWRMQYGDRARQSGIEDAGFHQDFLAAAIECGEIEAFKEYREWAARMLMARDIAPSFLSENLTQIGQALRIRLSASDADIVDSFIGSYVEARQDAVVVDCAPEEQLDQLTRLYVDAAIGGHRQVALNFLLEAVHQGHPVIDLYSAVLQKAMYRIGQLWEENTITVAQEHIATHITQFVIANLYPLIEPQPLSRGKIVITGVQGEYHQVGANMVADVLEGDGWDVRFLGTNTPVNSVLAAIEEHDASILGISATMLFHISSVARLVDSVRTKCGNRVRILLGGAAFRSAPSLYKELGANGCAFDLRTALALASEFASAGSST